MADKQTATAVALTPDPAKDVQPVKDAKGGLDEKATREAQKAARLTAWKRESTKAARNTAKAKRIEAWEVLTELKWEGER